MDIKKTFGTDTKLENEGVWVDLGEGAQIKVARIGNKESKALTKRLQAPHKIAIRNEKLPDDVWTKISVEVMAKTVLLDFKGIKEDGKEVPFSVENATRFLTDYKDFRDQVAHYANDLNLFQAEAEEAAIKN